MRFISHVYSTRMPLVPLVNLKTVLISSVKSDNTPDVPSGLNYTLTLVKLKERKQYSLPLRPEQITFRTHWSTEKQ